MLYENGFCEWFLARLGQSVDQIAKVCLRCLHFLPAAILENPGGPPTWRLLTKLYNFARNISENISTFGQRIHLKLGELTSLFIVLSITIS